ncbi:MAG: AbrB/MazE/SpoVT family DNA-binding domain-containing protein [Spirochaetales bacterium]|nr:AbrB/MazE/SpoVT family DNA-binding domain-containing protein [Spirochaetales bacterium]
MSTVRLGPKSQIVVPKEVRDMFGLQPGDSLVLMADINRGIALQKADVLGKIANAIFSGKGQEFAPGEKEENLKIFAEELRRTVTKKEDKP